MLKAFFRSFFTHDFWDRSERKADIDQSLLKMTNTICDTFIECTRPFPKNRNLSSLWILIVNENRVFSVLPNEKQQALLSTLKFLNWRHVFTQTLQKKMLLFFKHKTRKKAFQITTFLYALTPDKTIYKNCLRTTNFFCFILRTSFDSQRKFSSIEVLCHIENADGQSW